MILIHPAAAAEARDARLRYAERDPAVARRFLAEYDRALERIRDHPERWPLYPHVPGGFHWVSVPPVSVRDDLRGVPNVTHVLAVAADRRMPGYWTGRK